MYVDYTGQSMDTEPFNVITITFPAGKICANVPLTNSMIEGNHEAVNFTLNINNSSLLHSNVNVTVGDPAQATITTLDKYCKLEANTYMFINILMHCIVIVFIVGTRIIEITLT